ncbi:MAG: hypothetical protein RhofKO_30400 [Rhodothermales bacterium]
MKCFLPLLLLVTISVSGCADAPLTAEINEPETTNASPEPLIDADVLSLTVNGQALAPQELSMQLFVQPDSIYRRFVNGPRMDYLHPGEAFKWWTSLPNLGYVSMFVDGLIPRVTRYMQSSSKADVPFGSRFDVQYAASVCRTWQYRSASGPMADDAGTMRISYSDATRIAGTFTANLQLIEVSFFGDVSEACPNGINTARPARDEITIEGTFDIERPDELLLYRKLDDGRSVQEIWTAP